MPATFWDNFDHLVTEAETAFLQGDIIGAVEKWNAYFKITALTEWREIAEEAEEIWREYGAGKLESPDALYELWGNIRKLDIDNKISRYLRNLFFTYIAKIYRKTFKSNEVEDEGRSGILEYLSGDFSAAAELLKRSIEHDKLNMPSRIYLGWSYLRLKEQRSAISILTQNLFLAADKVPEEDLYLSQFKMLYGKLHSQRSNRQESAWLLTFESWYRNWLVFEEDESFYQLMRQKEIDERIFQVKYYLYERYRHFVRCLFIAEYNRQFNKKNTGSILEQENYMQRLDALLFEKYRKKRKALTI